ncbi:MAG: 50S ribosomal protein L18Ae [Nanopusillaceae archaeon]|jgi:large subunit ribosomal protein LX
MDVKIYRVEGEIEKIKIIRRSRKKEGKITKRKIKYKFVKELLGTSEKDILEKLYSIFGSLYKVKRNRIKIIKIEEIKEEDIRDKSLKKLIELMKNGEL